MSCTLHSVTLGPDGIAQLCAVTVNITNDEPTFQFVAEVEQKLAHDSMTRIVYNIAEAGYHFPTLHHIDVLVSPKDTTADPFVLELPVAIGILAETGQIQKTALDTFVFAGGLNEGGYVQPLRGTLAAEIAAQNNHLTLACNPASPWITTNCAVIENLAQLRTGVLTLSSSASAKLPRPKTLPDFSNISGLTQVKRALSIAAAANVATMLVGPDTSLARQLAKDTCAILPRLTDKELKGVLATYELYGRAPKDIEELGVPFIEPTPNDDSLRPPDTVKLAKGGVLYIHNAHKFSGNELSEFARALKHAEEKTLVIVSTTPCPCGRLGDTRLPCTCLPQHVASWQKAMSERLAPFCEIRVDVPSVTSDETTQNSTQLGIDAMRARSFARARYHRTGNDALVSARARAVLDSGTRRFALTQDMLDKTIRVARTIADMAQSRQVLSEHVIEALSLRVH